MKISIVIVNWNRWNELDKCLGSITKLIRKNYDLETIIVDNASIDKSAEKIRKNYPQFSLIESSKNLGFSGGNNLGIKKALDNKSDFIFILNNDTLLDKGAIEEFIRTYKKYQANILSPKIYFSPGYEFHKHRYKPGDLGKVIWYAGGIIDWNNVYGYHRGVDEVDRGQYDKTMPTNFATGAAMFIKSNVFEKIGFFDEKYFLYYEDIDFCLRAKQKTEKILYSPAAFLWHNNTGTKTSGSSLQDYYLTRNRLLFGFRYAPLRSKLALLKESLITLVKGKNWQKKGVKDFFTRNFYQGSYE